MTPARRLEQTKVRTRLGEWRVKRGMTQQEMVDATGISRTTYIAMEAGTEQDPSLRRLVNCAVVLGVELEELIEPEWREWFGFHHRAMEPPAPTRASSGRTT